MSYNLYVVDVAELPEWENKTVIATFANEKEGKVGLILHPSTNEKAPTKDKPVKVASYAEAEGHVAKLGAKKPAKKKTAKKKAD